MSEAKSDDVHRSRAKSKWETWRKKVTCKRPYRCQACGWRGWGVDVGPRHDPKDAELARDERQQDVDLDALDAAEPPLDQRRQV